MAWKLFWQLFAYLAVYIIGHDYTYTTIHLRNALVPPQKSLDSLSSPLQLLFHN